MWRVGCFSLYFCIYYFYEFCSVCLFSFCFAFVLCAIWKFLLAIKGIIFKMLFWHLSVYLSIMITLAFKNLLRFRFFNGCCPGSTWNSISQQCESKAIDFQNKMMKELCDLTQYFILLLIDIKCYETMWNQFTYSSKWIKIMKQISKNIESQCKQSVISECEW